MLEAKREVSLCLLLLIFCFIKGNSGNIMGFIIQTYLYQQLVFHVGFLFLIVVVAISPYSFGIYTFGCLCSLCLCFIFFTFCSLWEVTIFSVSFLFVLFAYLPCLALLCQAMLVLDSRKERRNREMDDDEHESKKNSSLTFFSI